MDSLEGQRKVTGNFKRRNWRQKIEKIPRYLYTSKNAQVVTSLNILQQLVTTSRYQDAFSWLATACDNKSVAICQQTCCKLSTYLLQVDYFNRLVATCFILTSRNKSAKISCNKPVKLTTCNKSVAFFEVLWQRSFALFVLCSMTSVLYHTVSANNPCMRWVSQRAIYEGRSTT